MEKRKTRPSRASEASAAPGGTISLKTKVRPVPAQNAEKVEETTPVATSKSVMLTLRISQNLQDELEKVAKRFELPVAAIARMCILQGLNSKYREAPNLDFAE